MKIVSPSSPVTTAGGLYYSEARHELGSLILAGFSYVIHITSNDDFWLSAEPRNRVFFVNQWCATPPTAAIQVDLLKRIAYDPKLTVAFDRHLSRIEKFRTVPIKRKPE